LPNTYFSFKQFTIQQAHAGMKVTTDACLFGAWVVIQLTKAEAHVIDIGTGTGLLSCMMAQAQNNYTIDAVDIDDDAIKDAQTNINALHFIHHITLIQANIITLPFTTPYDYIVCNPPFFKNSLTGVNAAKNKALHEQTFSIEVLVQKIQLALHNNGNAFILFPFNRLTELEGIIANTKLCVHNITYVYQTNMHKTPFRVFICLGKTYVLTKTQTIYIKANHQYTDAFIAYLKNYYLYL
jgi:tRNA1Val (adenine37-N6)-methyltransferase